MRRAMLASGILFLLLVAGCAGNHAPIAPAAGDSAPSMPDALPDQAVLGSWDLALDPAGLTAELAANRDSQALFDSYFVNVTPFQTKAPCHDCISVRSVKRNSIEGLDVTLRIRHPFLMGDPDLPISSRNRLDLHLFDPQLLVLGERGNVTIPGTEGGIFPARLVANPTGYSGLLLPIVQFLRPDLRATRFPYVTVSEDRTSGNFAASNPNGFAEPTNPHGFNVFPMGADVELLITLPIGIEEPPLNLTLLFTAAYGQSVVNRFGRLNPVYALPEFNAKAPWRIDIDIATGSNQLEAGMTGTEATVEVAVYDWQAGATIDPTLSNIGAIRSASDPVEVELSAPGVLLTPQVLAASSGTGPFDDPLRYTAQLANEAGAPEGTYVAAIRVRDARAPGGNTGGIPDAITSPEGQTIIFQDVTSFTTWQLATFDIAPALPTHTLLSIDFTPGTQQIIAQGSTEAITFTAIGTFLEPPLTEDISNLVNWISSATDVAAFAGPILTGVEMGTTYVHAELGAISSSATQPDPRIIVKPLEFTTVSAGFGWEIEAHRDTGDFYLMMNGPNRVQVYNIDGLFQREWPVDDFVNFARGLTIDEDANRVYVGSGQPGESINIVVYDTAGTRLMGYAPANAGDTWHYAGIVVLDNGEFWHRPFVPQTAYRYEPDTGAILDTWNNAPTISSVYDSASMGNLIVHSNPGYRLSGESIAIVDPAAHQVLALGGINPMPDGYSQNTVIALDRDNFIHLAWSVNTTIIAEPLVDVYEYIAPDQILGPLYTYALSTPGNSPNGIAVSLAENVVAINSSSPAITTFFR